MSHYYAEKVFRKVLLSPIYNGASNNLEIHLVSDLDEPIVADIELKVYKWDAFGETYTDIIQNGKGQGRISRIFG